MEHEETGLTYEEYCVIHHIVQAWNTFIRLEDLNADDVNDFKNSIHILQRILATRHMRREYPAFWNIPALNQ